MPRLDPARAQRLPHLHEAQERQEGAEVAATPLGTALAVETRDWGDGTWSIRTPGLPVDRPSNQLTGLRPTHLPALDAGIAWFDEADCAMHIRVPGPALAGDLGDRLGRRGFTVTTVEAWMAAPVEALARDGTDHDIRSVDGPGDVKAFGDAYCTGWNVTDPTAARLARAALCPWPAPPGWRRYTAFVDGQPAAVAMMTLFDDVAYLATAATDPRFRRRGLQRALLARRAADAADAGATLVFGGVRYGDQSWANMRAVGLREAFVTVGLARPRRSEQRTSQ